MTDAEIFGKLSRIFETHAFSREGEDEDEDLEELLEDIEQQSSRNYLQNLEKRGSALSPSRVKGDHSSDM